MSSPFPVRWIVRIVGGLLVCLTAGVTLGACSSSPGDAVSDAQASPDADPCALNGSFHVTFAPAAGSPAACACSQCSYDVAASHVTDSVSLASSNAEYFFQPLLIPDRGTPSAYSCDSTEISACKFQGNCLGTFSFSVANGSASGTQTFAFNDLDGGAIVTCTYDVTATPCGSSGPTRCTF